MGAIRFFDAEAVGYTEPVAAYPPQVLPLIRDEELTGSRVKIHHPGTDEQPQLLEVQVDPDLELASHSHDRSEIIVVIEGELQFGARKCGAGASVLVPGGTLYSVRAGPEGARFLNFRGTADYTYYNEQAHLSKRRQARAARPGAG